MCVASMLPFTTVSLVTVSGKLQHPSGYTEETRSMQAKTRRDRPELPCDPYGQVFGCLM